MGLNLLQISQVNLNVSRDAECSESRRFFDESYLYIVYGKSEVFYSFKFISNQSLSSCRKEAACNQCVDWRAAVQFNCRCKKKSPIFRLLNFQDENEKNMCNIPLPINFFNKLTGYVYFYNGRQVVLQRAEPDFMEGKFQVLEKIELPPSYIDIAHPKQEYVTLGNNHQEFAGYKFSPSNKNDGLQLA